MDAGGERPAKRLKLNSQKANDMDERKSVQPSQPTGSGLQRRRSGALNPRPLPPVSSAPGAVNDPAFVVRANDVINMKLVRTRADFDNPGNIFHPVFTHQIFMDEKIRGYLNLQINLYFAEASLITYLEITYDEKLDNPAAVDDVVGCLTKYLRSDYMTDKEAFLAKLDATKNFVPPGKTIHRYKRVAGSTQTSTNYYGHIRDDTDYNISYQIMLSKFNTPGFRAYHERIQFFLVFFIDASSFIDSSDLVWQILCLFERRQHKRTKAVEWSFLGYCTLYSFLSFPAAKKLRISQILILPPYQRSGHGGQLLQVIYDIGRSPEYCQINVEDPSDGFQFLRDLKDMTACRESGFFQMPQGSTSRSLPLYLKKLTDDYKEKVQKKLKLTDLQITRCYEAFKLGAINEKNENQYKNYRLEVKKRLYNLFREDIGVYNYDLAEKKKKLAELYHEVENKYRMVLMKLNEPPKHIFEMLSVS
eukprot:61495_1